MGARTFGSIYGLVDVETLELRYIGQTCDSNRRTQTHLRNHPNLRMVIMEVCKSDSLNEAERRWIREMRVQGARLLNRTEGGRIGHLGIKRSPETRAKLSIARRRQVPPMLGRKHSAETKAKMSTNNSMRRPEIVAKVVAAQRGRRVPDERRAKISATLKGNTNASGRRSPEARTNISTGLRKRWAKGRQNGS